MKYKFPEDKSRCQKYIETLYEKQCIVEVVRKKQTRSSQQNSALHLFFVHIAKALNDLGHTHKYYGISGKSFEVPYTEYLVKETLWRPIQKALFDIESTTKIDTNQMNEISDVIINYFAERGYEIDFPSIQSLMWKETINNYRE